MKINQNCIYRCVYHVCCVLIQIDHVKNSNTIVSYTIAVELGHYLLLVITDESMNEEQI